MAGKNVIVVGGGIIGASFAYHLVKAGAKVRLLDAESEAGGRATRNSWSWINASWGNAEPYFKLRLRSMELWRALDRAVPGLTISWTGGLLWDLPEVELRRFVQQQSTLGYDVRLVDREMAARIEPNLLKPPKLAAHARSEGAVEPVHAVTQLLQSAREGGADIIHGARVIRLVENDSRQVTGVLTQDGELDADCVVVAAGVASVELLASISVALPLEQPPGLLVHSHPAPELLNGLVITPQFHVRQKTDGALVAGRDFVGDARHLDPEAEAQNLFASIKEAIRGGEELRFSHYTVGYRPTPPDGVSAIGFIKGTAGLYLCVTHSGITLAPVLGQLGSREILEGQRDDLLSSFSPDRLIGAA